MAEAKKKVLIEVELDDKASANLDKLSGTMSKTKSKTGGLSIGFGKLATAFTVAQVGANAVIGAFKGLGKIANIASDVAMAGAEFTMLSKTSKRMAENLGVSNAEFDEMIKGLEDTNTFGSNAVKTVSSFIRTGLLPMADGLKRVNEKTGETVEGFDAFVLTAKDLGAAAGVSSSQAIDSLTRSLVTTNDEGLRTLGIEINLVEAYKSFADSVGITTGELTAQQKRQVILNKIMKEGGKVVGVYDEAYTTSAKNMLSMKDAIKSTSELLGSAFEPILFNITSALLKLVKLVRDLSKAFTEGFKTMLPDLENSFSELGNSLNALGRALGFSRDGAEDMAFTLGQSVAQGVNFAVQAITTLVNWAIELKKRFDVFWNSPAVQSILEWLNNLKQDTSEFIAIAGVAFLKWWKDIVYVYNNEVKPAFNELKEAVSDLMITIYGDAPTAKEELMKLAYIIGTILGQSIKNFLKLLGGAINLVKKAVNEYQKFTSFIYKTVNAVKALNNAIKNIETGALSGITNLFSKRQAGGMASGMTLVGEAGPELVNLPRGSRVYNNSETKEIVNNKPTVNMTNNYYNTEVDPNRIVGNLIYRLNTQI